MLKFSAQSEQLSPLGLKGLTFYLGEAAAMLVQRYSFWASIPSALASPDSVTDEEVRSWGAGEAIDSKPVLYNKVCTMPQLWLVCRDFPAELEGDGLTWETDRARSAVAGVAGTVRLETAVRD